MSDFTEQEFNEAVAELDGLEPERTCKGWRLRNPDKPPMFIPLPDYYNDLNQLMPIAWKQEIMMNFNMEECWKAVAYHDDDPSILTAEGYDADPVEAIRQCLWQIYKEQSC